MFHTNVEYDERSQASFDLNYGKRQETTRTHIHTPYKLTNSFIDALVACMCAA